MTRKKNVLFFIITIATMVFLFSCIGVDKPNDSAPGIQGSQPGSGSDTLTAIFTSSGVTGSVRLSVGAMAKLRSGQGGSGGDTLVVYLARRVCQPGSSGDTCYQVTTSYLK